MLALALGPELELELELERGPSWNKGGPWNAPEAFEDMDKKAEVGVELEVGKNREGCTVLFWF